MRWRDDFANNRRHEETGKIPSLVFRHEEKRRLKPIPDTPFDVDDVEPSPVTTRFASPSIAIATAYRGASRAGVAPTGGPYQG
jgi:hypothetical protein